MIICLIFGKFINKILMNLKIIGVREKNIKKNKVILIGYKNI